MLPVPTHLHTCATDASLDDELSAAFRGAAGAGADALVVVLPADAGQVDTEQGEGVQRIDDEVTIADSVERVLESRRKTEGRSRVIGIER